MLKIGGIVAASAFAGLFLFVATFGWKGIPAYRWPAMVYGPMQITEPFDDYMARPRRDAALGWTQAMRADPFPGEPCASAFGDSFTYSDEVGADEAWPALLSQMIGCRVENFGVPGYGSDQAFMRFKTMAPRGKTVILAHLSENAMRNVNQFRNLISPGTTEWWIKPRFLLSGELVPPVFEPGVRWLPEYFLPRDYFGRFTYAIAQAEKGNRPVHAEFYAADHPSRALDVTFNIMRAFVAEAGARGQTPVIAFLPTCRDLTQGIAYGPLVDKIKAAGWRSFDFGAAMLKRLSGQRPETLFGTCGAHPNAAGYRMMAEIAAEYLKGNNLTH